jgi:hypothetical protein
MLRRCRREIDARGNWQLALASESSQYLASSPFRLGLLLPANPPAPHDAEKPHALLTRIRLQTLFFIGDNGNS